jgi:hypothetical protein
VRKGNPNIGADVGGDDAVHLSFLPCLPQIKIGDHADFTTVVTPELNEQFLFAQHDYHERYWLGERPLVHPGLLASMSSLEFRVKPTSGWSGLAARDVVRFLGPAYVGEKLLVTWTAVDFIEKRGRPYFIKKSNITSRDRGSPVLERLAYTTYNPLTRR